MLGHGGGHLQEGIKRCEAAWSGGRASAASQGLPKARGPSLAKPERVSQARRGLGGMGCGDPGCSGLDWVRGGPRGHSGLALPRSRLAGGSLGLPDPCFPRRPHSPRSGMWRTMFPATPSSSTWHGRRVAPEGVRLQPALVSWGSRWRNRRHMTGGTGRSVGAPLGPSRSPRAWSRAAAGPGGAGARVRGGEGSSRTRRRRWWWPKRRRGGCILFPGDDQSGRVRRSPGPMV